ncbi:PREDICTED: uncharacterized protein LOC108558124 [Nicrophorus vespilloides]|uniref:Uncharacterized protein LOC108558124 n=1 Tax=Nicrophorus vespilloides TaxID=110193 RepID=A0ABM1M774_NICVS|nr:PREDICTED: uncharacterized protein LOC108558124 [Nicrophorus vespilloides]
MSLPLGVILFFVLAVYPADVFSVKCIENGKFYRDPSLSSGKAWTGSECAKYFLCLEGEVFEFRCSIGLLFDVKRQICDFKANVDNCDITIEPIIPRPLLTDGDCEDDFELACADSTCLPEEYFCDGSLDCPDGSDEGHCDEFIDHSSAVECDESNCKLPNCFCSADGTKVPGNLNPSRIPQIIMLAFEDAINFDNYDLFDNIILNENRSNPDGCPIKATFFVSHQYNNYQQTQRLWNRGHEIAVHSITHRGPEDWWSLNATIEDYFDEMVGQANILHKFSKIRMSEMKGFRVPFQKVGWNRQFLMAKEFGFLYDASIVAPFNDPPLWPYTLDYKIPHQCVEQNCPNRPYQGLWEMVQNPLMLNGLTCTSMNSCPRNLSGNEVYRMLHTNFKRHYSSNRAPFGLNLHSAWFKNADYLQAFQTFMDEILELQDVWFVTHTQAIKWMQNPQETNLHQIWGCDKHIAKEEIVCKTPNICKLYSQVFQQERYFHTCMECPPKYPWIRNEFGLD